MLFYVVNRDCSFKYSEPKLLHQAYQTSTLIEVEILKQNLQVACQGPLSLWWV